MDKIPEQNLEAHIAFVHRQKVFGLIPRQQIWEILQERKVDIKLILGPLEICPERSKSIIRTGAIDTKEFIIEQGHKQGLKPFKNKKFGNTYMLILSNLCKERRRIYKSL